MARRRDMRRINRVWDACNRKGEWHTFALVGSGKNRFIATLHAGAKTRADMSRVGDVYRGVRG